MLRFQALCCNDVHVVFVQITATVDSIECLANFYLQTQPTILYTVDP